MPTPTPKTPNNYFAEIILPLSVPGTFTYSVPENLQIQMGQRVVVAFRGNKLYTGIVHSFHSITPELFKAKPIIGVLDETPIVTQNQLQFWDWMAEYYLCSIGDVYRNALPSALKLESETFISKNPEKEIDWEVLDEYETLVLQSLENNSSLSLKELESFIPQQKIISLIKTLYEERWINIDEKLKQKYKPKFIEFIRVSPLVESNPLLFKETVDSLERAQKQKEFLFQLIQEKATQKEIEKLSFLKKYGYTNSILKSLQEKGVIEVYVKQKDRLEAFSEEVERPFSLTPAQNKAYSEIKENWKSKEVNVLEGITSSGKTEIYIQLIQEQLEAGKKSLYLLPEIAITTQLLQRLQKKFGNDIGVYHSKLNSQERVEVYKKVLQNKLKIIVGARSSLFLPFSQLGLVIVDEEHETSYKQTDTKPFFNAKDSALVLAQLQQAKVLLGSATPSLESYYHCIHNKYSLVELNERFGEVQPPEIFLLNLQAEGSHSGEISMELEKKMQEFLSKGKQIILFQNRRGYTPVMECVQCNYSPDCPNCDVKLTYHKNTQNLKCHYCNYTTSLPESCPVCQSKVFSYKGLGTQKIEEEVKRKFPDVSVGRMDSDTMKRKLAYEELFDKFESGQIQILIGTQMITKGLDFSNVGLVAVIRADALFNIPDFRVEEKSYQLLLQVAGRAGRRKERGEVVFQTYHPQNIVYQSIIHHKQKELYQYLLQERKDYHYPPYYKLIEIEYQHHNFTKVDTFSRYFTQSLWAFIPKEYVLGPTQPTVGKIRNQFIFTTLIKIPKGVSPKLVKEKLMKLLLNSQDWEGFKSIRTKVVVDPV